MAFSRIRKALVARWLVRLGGELVDLEEYARNFPSGDVFCFTEGEDFYLAGPVFDSLPSSEAVHEEATHVLGRVSGVIALLWPNLTPAAISSVIREEDSGQRNTFVRLTA